jgi:hypothetical protein
MEDLKDKVWIVKVPELVYNNILKSREKNIGQLDIYNTEGGKEFKATLNSSDARHFNVLVNESTNLFTFKDKVTNIRQADALCRFVSIDETHSDKLTKIVMNEEEANKPLIAIDFAKGRQTTESIIPLSKFQYLATTDNWEKALSQKNRKDKNLKKTRRNKDELKTEIFDLFSEKKYWTNKELVAKLDQPENYLKEVLSEICDYIKSGPKKGCYELKKQYVYLDGEMQDT